MSFSSSHFVTYGDCNYLPDRSRTQTEEIIRYIASTPEFCRYTKKFVAEVKKKIIDLHQYNNRVKKITKRYPADETFKKLLVKYVEVEAKVARRLQNEKYKRDMEERVLRLVGLLSGAVVDSNPRIPEDQKRHETWKYFWKILLRVDKDLWPTLKNLSDAIFSTLGVLDELKQLEGKTISDLSDPVCSTLTRNNFGDSYSSEDDDDDDEPLPFEVLTVKEEIRQTLEEEEPPETGQIQQEIDAEEETNIVEPSSEGIPQNRVLTISLLDDDDEQETVETEVRISERSANYLRLRHESRQAEEAQRFARLRSSLQVEPPALQNTSNDESWLTELTESQNRRPDPPVVTSTPEKTPNATVTIATIDISGDDDLKLNHRPLEEVKVEDEKPPIVSKTRNLPPLRVGDCITLDSDSEDELSREKAKNSRSAGRGTSGFEIVISSDEDEDGFPAAIKEEDGDRDGSGKEDGGNDGRNKSNDAQKEERDEDRSDGKKRSIGEDIIGELETLLSSVEGHKEEKAEGKTEVKVEEEQNGEVEEIVKNDAAIALGNDEVVVKPLLAKGNKVTFESKNEETAKQKEVLESDAREETDDRMEKPEEIPSSEEPNTSGLNEKRRSPEMLICSEESMDTIVESAYNVSSESVVEVTSKPAEVSFDKGKGELKVLEASSKSAVEETSKPAEVLFDKGKEESTVLMPSSESAVEEMSKPAEVLFDKGKEYSKVLVIRNESAVAETSKPAEVLYDKGKEDSKVLVPSSESAVEEMSKPAEVLFDKGKEDLKVLVPSSESAVEEMSKPAEVLFDKGKEDLKVLVPSSESAVEEMSKPAEVLFDKGKEDSKVLVPSSESAIEETSKPAEVLFDKGKEDSKVLVTNSESAVEETSKPAEVLFNKGKEDLKVLVPSSETVVEEMSKPAEVLFDKGKEDLKVLVPSSESAVEEMSKPAEVLFDKGKEDLKVLVPSSESAVEETSKPAEVLFDKGKEDSKVLVTNSESAVEETSKPAEVLFDKGKENSKVLVTNSESAVEETSKPAEVLFDKDKEDSQVLAPSVSEVNMSEETIECSRSLVQENVEQMEERQEELDENHEKIEEHKGKDEGRGKIEEIAMEIQESHGETEETSDEVKRHKEAVKERREIEGCEEMQEDHGKTERQKKVEEGCGEAQEACKEREEDHTEIEDGCGRAQDACKEREEDHTEIEEGCGKAQAAYKERKEVHKEIEECCAEIEKQSEEIDPKIEGRQAEIKEGNTEIEKSSKEIEEKCKGIDDSMEETLENVSLDTVVSAETSSNQSLGSISEKVISTSEVPEKDIYSSDVLDKPEQEKEESYKNIDESPAVALEEVIVAVEQEENIRISSNNAEKDAQSTEKDVQHDYEHIKSSEVSEVAQIPQELKVRNTDNLECLRNDVENIEDVEFSLKQHMPDAEPLNESVQDSPQDNTAHLIQKNVEELPNSTEILGNNNGVEQLDESLVLELEIASHSEIGQADTINSVCNENYQEKSNIPTQENVYEPPAQTDQHQVTINVSHTEETTSDLDIVIEINNTTKNDEAIVSNFEVNFPNASGEDINVDSTNNVENAFEQEQPATISNASYSHVECEVSSTFDVPAPVDSTVEISITSNEEDSSERISSSLPYACFKIGREVDVPSSTEPTYTEDEIAIDSEEIAIGSEVVTGDICSSGSVKDHCPETDEMQRSIMEMEEGGGFDQKVGDMGENAEGFEEKEMADLSILARVAVEKIREEEEKKTCETPDFTMVNVDLPVQKNELYTQKFSEMSITSEDSNGSKGNLLIDEESSSAKPDSDEAPKKKKTKKKRDDEHGALDLSAKTRDSDLTANIKTNYANLVKGRQRQHSRKSKAPVRLPQQCGEVDAVYDDVSRHFDTNQMHFERSGETSEQNYNHVGSCFRLMTKAAQKLSVNIERDQRINFLIENEQTVGKRRGRKKTSERTENTYQTRSRKTSVYSDSFQTDSELDCPKETTDNLSTTAAVEPYVPTSTTSFEGVVPSEISPTSRFGKPRTNRYRSESEESEIVDVSRRVYRTRSGGSGSLSPKGLYFESDDSDVLDMSDRTRRPSFNVQTTTAATVEVEKPKSVVEIKPMPETEKIVESPKEKLKREYKLSQMSNKNNVEVENTATIKINVPAKLRRKSSCQNVQIDDSSGLFSNCKNPYLICGTTEKLMNTLMSEKKKDDDLDSMSLRERVSLLSKMKSDDNDEATATPNVDSSETPKKKMARSKSVAGKKDGMKVSRELSFEDDDKPLSEIKAKTGKNHKRDIEKNKGKPSTSEKVAKKVEDMKGKVESESLSSEIEVAEKSKKDESKKDKKETKHERDRRKEADKSSKSERKTKKSKESFENIETSIVTSTEEFINENDASPYQEPTKIEGKMLKTPKLELDPSDSKKRKKSLQRNVNEMVKSETISKLENREQVKPSEIKKSKPSTSRSQDEKAKIEVTDSSAKIDTSKDSPRNKNAKNENKEATKKERKRKVDKNVKSTKESLESIDVPAVSSTDGQILEYVESNKEKTAKPFEVAKKKNEDKLDLSGSRKRKAPSEEKRKSDKRSKKETTPVSEEVELPKNEDASEKPTSSSTASKELSRRSPKNEIVDKETRNIAKTSDASSKVATKTVFEEHRSRSYVEKSKKKVENKEEKRDKAQKLKNGGEQSKAAISKSTSNLVTTTVKIESKVVEEVLFPIEENKEKHNLRDTDTILVTSSTIDSTDREDPKAEVEKSKDIKSDGSNYKKRESVMNNKLEKSEVAHRLHKKTVKNERRSTRSVVEGFKKNLDTSGKTLTEETKTLEVKTATIYCAQDVGESTKESSSKDASDAPSTQHDIILNDEKDHERELGIGEEACLKEVDELKKIETNEVIVQFSKEDLKTKQTHKIIGFKEKTVKKPMKQSLAKGENDGETSADNIAQMKEDTSVEPIELASNIKKVLRTSSKSEKKTIQNKVETSLKEESVKEDEIKCIIEEPKDPYPLNTSLCTKKKQEGDGKSKDTNGKNDQPKEETKVESPMESETTTISSSIIAGETIKSVENKGGSTEKEKPKKQKQEANIIPLISEKKTKAAKKYYSNEPDAVLVSSSQDSNEAQKDALHHINKQASSAVKIAETTSKIDGKINLAVKQSKKKSKAASKLKGEEVEKIEPKTKEIDQVKSKIKEKRNLDEKKEVEAMEIKIIDKDNNIEVTSSKDSLAEILSETNEAHKDTLPIDNQTASVVKVSEGTSKVDDNLNFDVKQSKKKSKVPAKLKGKEVEKNEPKVEETDQAKNYIDEKNNLDEEREIEKNKIENEVKIIDKIEVTSSNDSMLKDLNKTNEAQKDILLHTGNQIVSAVKVTETTSKIDHKINLNVKQSKKKLRVASKQIETEVEKIQPKIDEIDQDKSKIDETKNLDGTKEVEQKEMEKEMKIMGIDNNEEVTSSKDSMPNVLNETNQARKNNLLHIHNQTSSTVKVAETISKIDLKQSRKKSKVAAKVKDKKVEETEESKYKIDEKKNLGEKKESDQTKIEKNVVAVDNNRVEVTSCEDSIREVLDETNIAQDILLHSDSQTAITSKVTETTSKWDDKINLDVKQSKKKSKVAAKLKVEKIELKAEETDEVKIKIEEKKNLEESKEMVETEIEKEVKTISKYDNVEVTSSKDSIPKISNATNEAQKDTLPTNTQIASAIKVTETTSQVDDKLNFDVKQLKKKSKVAAKLKGKEVEKIEPKIEETDQVKSKEQKEVLQAKIEKEVKTIVKADKTEATSSHSMPKIVKETLTDDVSILKNQPDNFPLKQNKNNRGKVAEISKSIDDLKPTKIEKEKQKDKEAKSLKTDVPEKILVNSTKNSTTVVKDILEDTSPVSKIRIGIVSSRETPVKIESPAVVKTLDESLDILSVFVETKTDSSVSDSRKKRKSNVTAEPPKRTEKPKDQCQEKGPKIPKLGDKNNQDGITKKPETSIKGSVSTEKEDNKKLAKQSRNIKDKATEESIEETFPKVDFGSNETEKMQVEHGKEGAKLDKKHEETSQIKINIDEINKVPAENVEEKEVIFSNIGHKIEETDKETPLEISTFTTPIKTETQKESLHLDNKSTSSSIEENKNPAEKIVEENAVNDSTFKVDTKANVLANQSKKESKDENKSTRSGRDKQTEKLNVKSEEKIEVEIKLNEKKDTDKTNEMKQSKVEKKTKSINKDISKEFDNTEAQLCKESMPNVLSEPKREDKLEQIEEKTIEKQSAQIQSQEKQRHSKQGNKRDEMSKIKKQDLKETEKELVTAADKDSLTGTSKETFIKEVFESKNNYRKPEEKISKEILTTKVNSTVDSLITNSENKIESNKVAEPPGQSERTLEKYQKKELKLSKLEDKIINNHNKIVKASNDSKYLSLANSKERRKELLVHLDNKPLFEKSRMSKEKVTVVTETALSPSLAVDNETDDLSSTSKKRKIEKIDNKVKGDDAIPEISNLSKKLKETSETAYKIETKGERDVASINTEKETKAGKEMPVKIDTVAADSSNSRNITQKDKTDKKTTEKIVGEAPRVVVCNADSRVDLQICQTKKESKNDVLKSSDKYKPIGKLDIKLEETVQAKGKIEEKKNKDDVTDVDQLKTKKKVKVVKDTCDKVGVTSSNSSKLNTLNETENNLENIVETTVKQYENESLPEIVETKGVLKIKGKQKETESELLKTDNYRDNIGSTSIVTTLKEPLPSENTVQTASVSQTESESKKTTEKESLKTFGISSTEPNIENADTKDKTREQKIPAMQKEKQKQTELKLINEDKNKSSCIKVSNISAKSSKTLTLGNTVVNAQPIENSSCELFIRNIKRKSSQIIGKNQMQINDNKSILEKPEISFSPIASDIVTSSNKPQETDTQIDPVQENKVNLKLTVKSAEAANEDSNVSLIETRKRKKQSEDATPKKLKVNNTGKILTIISTMPKSNIDSVKPIVDSATLTFNHAKESSNSDVSDKIGNTSQQPSLHQLPFVDNTSSGSKIKINSIVIVKSATNKTAQIKGQDKKTPVSKPPVELPTLAYPDAKSVAALEETVFNLTPSKSKEVDESNEPFVNNKLQKVKTQDDKVEFTISTSSTFLHQEQSKQICDSVQSMEQIKTDFAFGAAALQTEQQNFGIPIAQNQIVDSTIQNNVVDNVSNDFYTNPEDIMQSVVPTDDVIQAESEGYSSQQSGDESKSTKQAKKLETGHKSPHDLIEEEFQKYLSPKSNQDDHLSVELNVAFEPPPKKQKTEEQDNKTDVNIGSLRKKLSKKISKTEVDQPKTIQTGTLPQPTLDERQKSTEYYEALPFDENMVPIGNDPVQAVLMPRGSIETQLDSQQASTSEGSRNESLDTSDNVGTGDPLMGGTAILPSVDTSDEFRFPPLSQQQAPLAADDFVFDDGGLPDLTDCYQFLMDVSKQVPGSTDDRQPADDYMENLIGSNGYSAPVEDFLEDAGRQVAWGHEELPLEVFKRSGKKTKKVVVEQYPPPPYDLQACTVPTTTNNILEEAMHRTFTLQDNFQKPLATPKPPPILENVLGTPEVDLPMPVDVQSTNNVVPTVPDGPLSADAVSSVADAVKAPRNEAEPPAGSRKQRSTDGSVKYKELITRAMANVQSNAAKEQAAPRRNYSVRRSQMTSVKPPEPKKTITSEKKRLSKPKPTVEPSFINIADILSPVKRDLELHVPRATTTVADTTSFLEETPRIQLRTDLMKANKLESAQESPPPSGGAISISEMVKLRRRKQTAAPAHKEVTGLNTWECDTCLVRNDKEKTKCVKCETPRKGGSASLIVRSSAEKEASNSDVPNQSAPSSNTTTTEDAPRPADPSNSAKPEPPPTPKTNEAQEVPEKPKTFDELFEEGNVNTSVCMIVKKDKVVVVKSSESSDPSSSDGSFEEPASRTPKGCSRTETYEPSRRAHRSRHEENYPKESRNTEGCGVEPTSRVYEHPEPVDSNSDSKYDWLKQVEERAGQDRLIPSSSQAAYGYWSSHSRPSQSRPLSQGRPSAQQQPSAAGRPSSSSQAQPSSSRGRPSPQQQQSSRGRPSSQQQQPSPTGRPSPQQQQPLPTGRPSPQQQPSPVGRPSSATQGRPPWPSHGRQEVRAPSYGRHDGRPQVQNGQWAAGGHRGEKPRMAKGWRGGRGGGHHHKPYGPSAGQFFHK